MDFVTDFLGKLLGGAQGAGASSIGIGAPSISFVNALIAILVAYLGGVLSSLTPCIYPMIPITVSVVGGAGKRDNWMGVFLRGGSYVGGMAVVYSFLGVLAGLTGKVFGSFTNTPGWYFALGLVMTAAALWMLDVFSFDPMMWWSGVKRKWTKAEATHAADVRAEMTHVGAFLLGASSGFIAAPCTTPVLTSILAYIAKTQSIGLGLVLMLSFSLGLGTILLAIAAFAGAARVLPRSGRWMEKVKKFSGLILLAFAEYLIYRAGAAGGLVGGGIN